VSSREFQDRLARRARRAGVTISPTLAAKLEAYFKLLTAWNTKMNLTGLDLAEQGPAAIDRLLVEPLVASKHVTAPVTRMIDIGSGGGSPAIPLALALSSPHLMLVEAKARKSVFLREALRALEMSEAEVATSRFEELLARPPLHEAHELLVLFVARRSLPRGKHDVQGSRQPISRKEGRGERSDRANGRCCCGQAFV